MTETANQIGQQAPASRRAFVAGAVAGAVALALAPRLAVAAPAQVEAEIQKLYAGKSLAEGKIKLDLPSIAENGLVVPLNVDVRSEEHTSELQSR